MPAAKKELSQLKRLCRDNWKWCWWRRNEKLSQCYNTVKLLLPNTYSQFFQYVNMYLTLWCCKIPRVIPLAGNHSYSKGFWYLFPLRGRGGTLKCSILKGNLTHSELSLQPVVQSEDVSLGNITSSYVGEEISGSHLKRRSGDKFMKAGGKITIELNT